MDLERVFVTQLVKSGRVRDAINGRIRVDYFSPNNDSKPLYEFITDFYGKYKTAPSEEVIREKFPKYEFDYGDAAFEWLCDELARRHVHNSVNAAMHEVAKTQKLRSPEKSLEILQKLVTDSTLAIKKSRDVSWKETALERIPRYQELKDLGGITGIPFPWETLTRFTGGMNAGEYWMIGAKSSIGKTWVECIMAHCCFLMGYKVLLATIEMTAASLHERLDALNAQIPFDKFRKALLVEDDEERHFTALRNLAAAPSDIIVADVDGSEGIGAIDARVDLHRPDILFIDGLYLLNDDLRGHGKSERLMNISQATKALAKRRGLPVTASSQLNKEGGDDDASIEDMYYASALSKDADGVLFFFQPDEMKQSQPPQLLARLKKFRQTGGGEWTKVINWDHERMIFTETEAGNSPRPDRMDDIPAF